ncbi:hypothetical protein BGW38_008819, partial [Lunasporangiospora selenospora]
GGHLNPAVTLAMAIFRGFAWADVLIYWIAQFAGAFFGALIVYITNYSAIKAANPATTIGIFITGLQNENVSTTAGFPLIIGLSLAAIGTSFGYETGFALNPARDLAPRLLTFIFGWGWTAFSRQSYYFWVPIVAPFIGAVGGAFIYDLLIYAGPSPLNN